MRSFWGGKHSNNIQHYTMFDFSVVTKWFDAIAPSDLWLEQFLGRLDRMCVVGLIVLTLYALIAMFMIYFERKVCAFFQCRLGPMRVGKWGIFQVVADVLKMLIKEIFGVDRSDKFLYTLAPFLTIIASVGTFSFLPWNKGAVVLDFNVGVFMVTAISSIGVLGVILSGWGSNNKYSVVSAMRGAVQMISYEISLGLCMVTAVILCGSMQLSDIIGAQTGPWKWLIIQGHIPAIVAFLVFLIAGNAEANRGPFDLAEAESELTAGYHTEYSGMGFGYFYLAEYLNLVVISGLAATIFLGGWAPLNIGISGFDTVMNYIPGFIWFAAKTLLVIWVLMWARWTFPRLRIDQILTLEWKYLMPCMLLTLTVMTACVALGLTL
jgi:NADH-quinone oxidoreductase subunit H